MLGTVLAGGEHDLAVLLRGLPMIAAGPLIGIPEKYWESVAFHATASIAPDDPIYAIGRSTTDTLRRAHHHLFIAFTETLGACPAGGASLVSALRAVELEGRPLDDHALLLNSYSFSLGANSTTSHVAAQLLLALAERPGVWQAVRDDRSLIPGLLDEGVRWSSPTNHL
ncbi:cytochrome P450, partial [Streptomyces decoyicus]